METGPFQHYQAAFAPDGRTRSVQAAAALWAWVQRLVSKVQPIAWREDVASGVFLKLAERAAVLPRRLADEGDPELRFKAYVRAMIRNAAADLGRQHTNHHAYDEARDAPLAAAGAEGAAQLGERSADASALQARVNTLVETAIGEVPARYQAERRSNWEEMCDLAYDRRDYDTLVRGEAAPDEPYATAYNRLNRRHTRQRAKLGEWADGARAEGRISEADHRLLTRFLQEFLPRRASEPDGQVSEPTRAGRPPREERP